MILSSLTEKPISYYVGWRRLASIAGPSCAAPTSRAAPTPWHMSTAGVKRHDLPPICGMALYMTVALPAWKSSFLYSVTHTAAPNSDETGVTKWAVRLLFFSFFCKMTSLIDVPLQYTLQQLPLTRLLHFANRLRLKEKKNSHRTSFTGRCVKATEKNIFVWPTFIMRKKIIPEKKIPELTYFSSDASDCTYQWETAEWTCKILFRQKKTGWLKYFECKIIVPFWCFEAFLVHLKERGKKGNIHSITYLPLLPSFERRNWTVLKPKSLTCF